MAPAQRAERVTGYVAGGISPLGQRRALPAFMGAGPGAGSSAARSGTCSLMRLAASYARGPERWENLDGRRFKPSANGEARRR